MDNKQKRQIMSALYKAFALFAILAIGWVAYFSIDALVKEQGYLWLNITLLAVAFLLLTNYFANVGKVKKIKNFFGVSKFLFFLAFMTFVGAVAGIFVVYYLNYAISFGYYLTIGVLLVGEVFVILMLIVGLQLTKLFKNTTITIDEVSEVPNYDDELMLKKKLDELNRKLEMKKVSEQIEAVKKQLGEE